MRLSSNLTIKIKLFDILFYNTLYFRELIKLIFLDAPDILTNGRRITPFAPTGGEKIWIIRMAPRMEGWEYGFGVWSPVGKIKREKFK